TQNGIAKRTPVAAFANIRSNGLIALTLRDDDELIGVKMTSGEEEIVIGTRDGMLIKFNETDIRSMGRIAGGVRGIRLRKGDIAVGMDVVDEGKEILVVTEKGFG
ncbi:DNA gyrase subunit A, partial [Microvirga sp. 3-52]|nr:DNA gyrase subunit A [Microvirga sp. 3-52]